MRRRLAAALVLALLLPAWVAAQETAVVYGTVRDSAGKPIDRALVRIAGTPFAAFTDSSGVYRLAAPSGRVVVVVERIAFRTMSDTVTLAAGDSRRVDFTLAPKPGVLLDDLPRQLPRAMGGTVLGTVRDQVGRPLERALVQFAGTSRGAYTDALGRYRLTDVAPGTVVLEAVRIGYVPARETVTVAAGDSVRVDFAVSPKEGLTLNDIFQLPPVLVTPSKSSQLVEQTSTSVAVVSEHQLARRAVNTVDEAVDKAPGVQFLNGQVNIRGSSGYVLGLGSRVLVLVDGVPANQGDRGGIHWDLLPVDQVERVEIVKGAGSALYGSAAVGGVVNLLTRDIPVGTHARLRTTAGAYADPPHEEWRFRSRTGLQEGVDLTGSYGTPTLRGRLAAGTRHSDGYREQDARDHWQMAGKGEWHASPRSRLDVSGAWASDQYQTALMWCTQGRCDDRGQAYQPFKADTGGKGDHTFSYKGYLAATLLRSDAESTVTWQGRASWVRTRFTDYQRSGNDFSIANRFGAELRATARHDTTRTVTIGAELSASDLVSDIFCGTPNATCSHTQGEYAAYGQNEGRLGTVRLTTGARIDFLAVDGSSLTAVVSPRVGAVLPARTGRWRASLGRGFRAPAMAERFPSTTVLGLSVIPNPDLDPETSWSLEVGNTLAVGSTLGVDAAAFWTEARNLIEPFVDLSVGQIQLRNTPRSRLAGLDLMLGVVPLPGLTTALSYTFLHARALAHDTIPERPLAFRPEHLLTLTGDYTVGRFGVGADFRYMSRFANVELFQDLSLFPADRRAAARVLDLRASWERGPVAAHLQVANALNFIYNLVPRTLAPVRTVTLTLTWSY
ncbi:MAG: TonB-dependent receptor [Gemmatimonadetes bacterium]|nr:TonB-dependent receptor [Gemmatimonadota bacterium]